MTVKLTDRQLDEEFPLMGNHFHMLQDLLKNLESYLEMPLEHRTTSDTYSLLHHARRVVRDAVQELEEGIVADAIYTDNKSRD